MKRFSIAFEAEQFNKIMDVWTSFQGEKFLYDPMSYEQVDDIISKAYAFMKSDALRSQVVTFGKEDEHGKVRSICRVYRLGHGLWDTVYWRSKNSTDSIPKVPQAKKTIKELVLFAMKFDPAM